MIQKIKIPAIKIVATPPIAIPAIAPAPSPSFLFVFVSGMVVGVAIATVVEDATDVDILEDWVGMVSGPPSLVVTLRATLTLKPEAAAHPYPTEFPPYR